MNTWRNRAGRIFERKLRGKADIKAELLEDDRQAMLPLPPIPSKRGAWSFAKQARCRWSASTATTTRYRPNTPIRR